MFDSAKSLVKEMQSGYQQVSGSGGCDNVPRSLSESEIASYAARCGDAAAKSYVASELGIDPAVFVDAAGKVDPKRAAIEALKIDGILGVDTSGWFTPGGDVAWGGIAGSVGGVAAGGACAAAGAAAAAPLCASIGATVSTFVVDGVIGFVNSIGADDVAVEGRFASWHYTPLGMLACAAQYFTLDGTGPTAFSYASTQEGGDVMARLLQEGGANPGLSLLRSARLSVLEMCGVIELAQMMYEQATGQAITWRGVFDAFQSTGLDFNPDLFYLLSHEDGTLFAQLGEDGYSIVHLALHDLATLAYHPDLSGQDWSKLAAEPAILRDANLFLLTRYDDPSWQKEAGISVANAAPSLFTFLFAAGIADFYTKRGLEALRGVPGGSASKYTKASYAGVLPAYDAAKYNEPTPGWRYAIGPAGTLQLGLPYSGMWDDVFASFGQQYNAPGPLGDIDAYLQPAMLWAVTTTCWSVEEQVGRAELMVRGYDFPYIGDGSASRFGWYTMLPGSWWSRHALFWMDGANPQNTPMVNDQTVRINSVATDAVLASDQPWTPDDGGPRFEKLGAIQSSAGSMNGTFDILRLTCNRGIVRTVFDDPAKFARWSGAQRARLDRCMSIFRQEIRRWRRKNVAPSGAFKPQVSTLDLSKAMQAGAQWFDTGMSNYDDRPDGDGGGAGSGAGEVGMLSGLSKPARYALGAVAVTAAGFLLAKLWKGIRR